MNIVVLGPGAIGSLWAHSLHCAGHSVSLWSRSDGHTHTIQVDDGRAIVLANHDTPALEQADLLLVTVKAPQVTQAIQPLLKHLHSECIVLLMHNGMGTAEPTSKILTGNPLVLATTTHGVYRQSDSLILHTGLGTTQLGGYNAKGKQCQFLEDVLHHALPNVSWNPNIQEALWHKLAINCAINPMTAIHQITNGELNSNNYSKELDRVINEVSQVMNAEGITTSLATLKETVYKVINATAKNHSSMQQDIFYHRTSEIDFITGYLLERAKAHNIAAPSNAALYEQIKRIEQSWKSS
ncbi:2-dehydropantoate 2-reductase [Vibrio japonicus]|uniref:2-dehydropantoate 2-reductase n=1 Tax=Vibrio japonicus TaxID=1824638 RepID=A0ABY5LI57_9VIBR|nr:2-dehydropantoate 2-reductase [Vibrio japonicus]UUM31136.1 2-dehydropantoate 2-reductase [Vibrio japonicus]